MPLALALALGDRVEEDGGEVGHQVRRLPAQRWQIPHLSRLEPARAALALVKRGRDQEAGEGSPITMPLLHTSC